MLAMSCGSMQLIIDIRCKRRSKELRSAVLRSSKRIVSADSRLCICRVSDMWHPGNKFSIFFADTYLIGDKVRGVESYTELSNHTDISTSRESLHETLGAGLGNCAKIVDKVSFGHSDTGIL